MYPLWLEIENIMDSSGMLDAQISWYHILVTKIQNPG